MKVEEMIRQLEAMGFKVTSRHRSDGGMIITKINNMTFTGASGNQYARKVLGVELSQARIEQTQYNVQKFIKGATKKKALDEDMKKELKRVQRQWRKKGVKGQVTAKKVKQHIAESGKEEAKAYLGKMERYGQGLAYESNVEWLAQYTEGVARGYIIDDDVQKQLFDLADFIRSIKDRFKESWISEVYKKLYDILEYSPDVAIANEKIAEIYYIIK